MVGENGSGKSLYGMHLVERELAEGHRNIVTTLAIDVPALNEYMQRKYPKRDCDVCGRVLVIGKEELKTFWRYRGIERMGEYGPEPYVMGPFGDDTWSGSRPQCLYVLDEAQVCFNAREWMKTGPEFCQYQSQHRKAGDDVIAITPGSTLLDKQFRTLAAECIVLKNLYKAKSGVWKGPRKIVWRSFANCPPLPGEDHYAKGDIQIDAKGLASCYRTADGVGFVGGCDADKGKESKGIPWYYGIVLAVVLGFAGWWVIGGILKFGVKKGSESLSVSGGAVPAAVQAAVASTNVANGAFQRVSGASAVLNGSGPFNLDAAVKAARVTKVEKPEVWEIRSWSWSSNSLGVVQGCVILPSGQPIFGKKLEDRGRYVLLDGERYSKVSQGSDRGREAVLLGH